MSKRDSFLAIIDQNEADCRAAGEFGQAVIHQNVARAFRAGYLSEEQLVSDGRLVKALGGGRVE